MMMKLKPTITYDFDGVLHKSMKPVKQTGPTSYTKWDEWIPFKEMHQCLREDSKNNRIIIAIDK